MKRKLNSNSLEKLLREQLWQNSVENELENLTADLLTSSGPWIVLPGGDALLDAAQTAGLLGFNAGASFGTAQYLESWTGQNDTATFGLFQESFDAFLARKPAFRAQTDLTADAAKIVLAYIQANVVDQFEAQVSKLEQLNRDLAEDTGSSRFSSFQIQNMSGLSATLKCKSEEIATGLVSTAIGFGVLLPQSEGCNIQFRMNLSWTEETLRMFWNRMELADQAVTGKESSPSNETLVTLRDPSGYFRFHQAMIDNKLAIAFGRQPTSPGSAIQSVLGFVRDNLKDFGMEECQPVVVSEENWPQFRGSVNELQGEVYEPARQTPMEKFDKLVKSPRGMGLLILQCDKIIAIAFAGPLSLFPGERGTSVDPWREDPDVLYMLDVTVRKSFRGSLGRLMKQALTLLAVVSGCSAIHGRNLDRLAGSMWAINLSVGSFQIRHLADDYPDKEKYRDCIYYRCPLKWNLPDEDTPESALAARLGDLSSDQLNINLARLANGFSPVFDGKADGWPANLVPVWHRRI